MVLVIFFIVDCTVDPAVEEVASLYLTAAPMYCGFESCRGQLLVAHTNAL